MDIRKFFSPNGASKKPSDGARSSGASKTPPTKPKSTEASKTKIPSKPEKAEKKDKKQVGLKETNSLRSSTKQAKKPIVEEEPLTIDSESDNEDVIQSTPKPTTKSKISSKDEKKKPSETKKLDKGSESKKNRKESTSKKSSKDSESKKPSTDTKNKTVDSDVEIESVESNDSHSKEESKKRGSLSDKKATRTDDQKTKPSPKTSSSASSGKDAKSKKDIKKSSSKNYEKINVVSESDEEVNTISSDDSDDDEIASRRIRGKKRKSSSAKNGSRFLDSDSEEDPLPMEKPKAKRKKKDHLTFVDDSDEEKKETLLDKFVVHSPHKQTSEPKKKTEKKEEKGKPTSVADFFGAGVASRSHRLTAVAKNNEEAPKLDAKKKEEEKKKNEKKKDDDDILFDDEFHDDSDFAKTLEQLDKAHVKKDKTSPVKAQEASAGSLASKLSGKVKALKETSFNNNATSEAEKTPKKTSDSPEKRKASPMKTSPVTVKKGKVYTMEVTNKKKETIVVSPSKPKAKEDTTPPKKPTPSKTGSESKKQDDDDGFGPKVIHGFQAYKNRAGPLALGSKEIPEGAENCLEGLAFVITGVLDSIERDQAKSLVEKYGGRVTNNISGRTSYVVVGREPGDTKIAKAKQLKVKQIDEDELFEMIRTNPGKVSKYELKAQEETKKEEAEKAAQSKEAVVKKLESFKSEKEKATPSSSTETKSLFTQIKDSSDVKPAKTEPVEQVGSGKSKEAEDQSDSLLWVDKHKPTSMKQIIGQNGDKSNANKLQSWLKSWHENIIVKKLKPAGNFFGRGDGTGCRAALLSGPPGIGKTTTATLVCKECGFSYIELNASDTRSKRSLKEVVAESLNNNTLVDYMGNAKSSSGPSGQSHCIIMDEVDGMAGNEDRGGLQELVQLIKNSKIPIICICNDRNSMKMRTLANYCLDLRFQRPRAEQIKGRMMSIAYKEGLKIPANALQEIIEASNHDIRQIIHNMSVWSADNKNLSYDQVKQDAKKAQKDLKIGPFDVCRKVFVNDDETRKMSIHDKSDLFFQDYSFGPLFVHENYPHVIPQKANSHHGRHMSCLSRTIDSICDGDLVDKLVRKEGNWNLLPVQAMFSSVIPGEVMRGSFPHMTSFPQWLGKYSSTGKTERILQELGMHMRLEVSCDKRGLNMDYLPALRKCLTQPLVTHGSEGVPDVIKVMDAYDIIKEDFDNIMEVSKWPNSVDPMSKLETKTKAAFTRQYNKEIHLTPYATGSLTSKKRKARGAPMDESEMILDEEGEGAQVDSGEEEEEGIDVDSMIKTKKPSGKGKGSTSSQSSGKGGSGKGAASGKGDGGGKGKGGKGKR